MTSSKLLAVFVAVFMFGALFAGSAAAVQSTPTDLPEESEVGTEFEATFELTELFDEFGEWTLSADTQLQNSTWTIRQYNQAGDEISREDTDGQNATQAVDIDEGTARVDVRVTGTTPEVEEWSYEPADSFVVANFTQEREGGSDRDIATHESHHYITESKDAREAIDRAHQSVEGSGSDSARSSLDSAISAYESGNFENAVNLAERAEDEASQSQLIRNALIGVAVVVVLALLVAVGYRVYKSRQKGPGRLR